MTIDQERPAARANWLFEFLARDLDQLRPGDWLNVAEDAWRFLTAPTVVAAGQLNGDELRRLQTALRHGLAPERIAEQSWFPFGTEVDLVYSFPEAIEREWTPLEKADLYDRVRETLPGYLKSVEILINTAPHPVVDRGNDRFIVHVKGTTLDHHMTGALALLSTIWPQVRRCAYAPCGRRFVPEDAHQRFHDPECSRLKRWEKYKPHRPRKTERRRARHAEPVQHATVPGNEPPIVHEPQPDAQPLRTKTPAKPSTAPPPSNTPPQTTPKPTRKKRTR